MELGGGELRLREKSRLSQRRLVFPGDAACLPVTFLELQSKVACPQIRDLNVNVRMAQGESVGWLVLRIKTDQKHHGRDRK